MITPLFALASLLSVLLAAGLWASLRALRNAQGRNRAILAAAVDSTVTIDGQGTARRLQPRRRAAVRSHAATR